MESCYKCIIASSLNHCEFKLSVNPSVWTASTNHRTGSPLPTQLAMKKKSLSAHQLPLELSTSQMFFPQPFFFIKTIYMQDSCWNSVPYNHCQTSLELYSWSHWNLDTLIITQMKCNQQLLKSSWSTNPIYFLLIPILNKH